MSSPGSGSAGADVSHCRLNGKLLNGANITIEFNIHGDFSEMYGSAASELGISPTHIRLISYGIIWPKFGPINHKFHMDPCVHVIIDA